jgi:hypothetical protein
MLSGRRDVDRAQPGVREGTPDDARPQLSRPIDIRDELSGAREQGKVFRPRDVASDEGV